MKFLLPGLLNLTKTHVIFVVSNPLRERKFVTGDFYVYDWEPIEKKSLMNTTVPTWVIISLVNTISCANNPTTPQLSSVHYLLMVK